MEGADKLLWSVQVDHQLFALAKLDVTVSSVLRCGALGGFAPELPVDTRMDFDLWVFDLCW